MYILTRAQHNLAYNVVLYLINLGGCITYEMLNWQGSYFFSFELIAEYL